MGNCKNSMKNNWFLACFRPEKSLKPNTESERNIFFNRTTSIPSPNDQKNTDPCPDDANDDGRKSPRRRRFRRFFDRIISSAASPLSKKKRNKGSGKEAHNNSSKFHKIFNTSSKKKSKSLLSAESFSILSSHSSLFSQPTLDSNSSRSSSSSSSSFPPIFTTSRKKQTCMDKNSSFRKLEKHEEKKDGNCSSPKRGIGLYFLLAISLVGLIFWGEALAILCTSIALFLFSFINGGVSSKYKDSSIDNEYKRKVVMEGIPERRYCRKP